MSERVSTSALLEQARYLLDAIADSPPAAMRRARGKEGANPVVHGAMQLYPIVDGHLLDRYRASEGCSISACGRFRVLGKRQQQGHTSLDSVTCGNCKRTASYKCALRLLGEVVAEVAP